MSEAYLQVKFANAEIEKFLKTLRIKSASINSSVFETQEIQKLSLSYLDGIRVRTALEKQNFTHPRQSH